MAAMWENIQQGELKAQQQHQEAVGLVQELKEQVNTKTDRDALGLWVSQLIEPKFIEIKGEMEKEVTGRTQVSPN